MASKYLDYDGLLYLKQKIKTMIDTSITDGVEVPDKVSDLENDSGFIDSDTASEIIVGILTSSKYQTEDEVSNAITNALADITGIDFEIVTELPSTGTKGVVYLLSNSGASGNSYDEYIFVNNAFEKLGTTDVDLTGYLKSEDIDSITNEDIDTIFS